MSTDDHFPVDACEHDITDGVECPFTGGDVHGEVVEGRDDAAFVWACPVCGHTNVTPLEPIGGP